MLKKLPYKTLPCLLFLFMLWVPTADASIRVSYGAWIPTGSDASTEYGPTAGLGFFAFDDLLQLEAEVSYLSRDRNEQINIFGNDVNLSGSEKLIPFYLNANLYFPLPLTGVSIYGGASIGAAYVNIKGRGEFDGITQSEEGHDLVFSYGFGAGFLVRIADPLHLDLRYRYLLFQDASFDLGGSIGSVDYKIPDMHQISLGVVFKF